MAREDRLPGLFDEEFFEIPRIMRKQMNRALKEFFEEAEFPKVDIIDKKDSIIVKADVPGVPKDKLNIRVRDNGIVIKGDLSEEKEEKDGSYYMRERYISSFYRDIELPSDVDPNSAKAKYENGVLTIELKKRKEEIGKEIPVE
ncbi:MAG: heat-shock protein [Candidatus Micrarchaeota archaeon]|nr:MAG: heat-shock protein [Candidatus Micrarchaeota archaeon]